MGEPDGAALNAANVRDYEVKASFRADRNTGIAIAEAMRLAALAVIGEATGDEASALFRISGAAVVHAAQEARDAA